MRHYSTKASVNKALNSTEIQVNLKSEPYCHYDSLIYVGRPHMNLEPIRIVYVHEMWPVGHDRIEPHIPTLEALAPTLSGVVCLDIEHWPWYKATEEVKQETIRKLILVVNTIKAINPDVELGYYSLMPQRNYWIPIKQYPEQLAAW